MSAAIRSIDLHVHASDLQAVIEDGTSSEMWSRAQKLLNKWDKEIAFDTRDVTVEIEWENGLVFAAEMTLEHPLMDQPIEERDLTAHVLRYLAYCIGETDTWAPLGGLVRTQARYFRDLDTALKVLDFRNEEKRAWAQAILDECWLPE